MARRILLMNPSSGLYRRDDRCQSKVEDQSVRVVFPPVELAVMAFTIPVSQFTIKQTI